MLNNRGPYRLAALVFCALLVAGGGTAIALGVSAGPNETITTADPATTDATASTASSSDDRPTSATVAASITESYATFRRPRSEADAMPDPAVALGHRGSNPDFSRRVGVDGKGGPYYAVPGKETLCLETVRGAGSCTDLPKTPIFVKLCAPGLAADSMRVNALLADDQTEPRVRYQDGEIRRLDVVDNAVIADVPKAGGPIQIEWDSPEGQHSEPLAVPPDAAAIRCATP